MPKAVADSPSPRTNRPFPEAARKLIARDGRTLRELGAIVPYSFPFLHRIINGERNATVEQIEQLAEALGYPGSYFVEVRLHRVAEHLRRHPKLLEELFEQLPVARD